MVKLRRNAHPQWIYVIDKVCTIINRNETLVNIIEMKPRRTFRLLSMK